LIALRRRPTIQFVGLLALACSGRVVPIEVRAELSDSEPLVGVAVTALPYDPQQLLDSLAARDTTPRPDFPGLEGELRSFTRPAPAADDSLDRAWRATQDTTRRLADSLRRLDRHAPGYAAAYGRFRQLYRRLVERSGARDAALRGPTADVRALAERAGRAADSLRAWERSAYAGFDTAAALAVEASGREPVAAETDADGWAHFDLPSGRWWVVLQLRHPENPFLEYTWRVPLTVAGFPVRVPLSGRNASLGWRH
jgi:hypothetical protein